MKFKSLMLGFALTAFSAILFTTYAQTPATGVTPTIAPSSTPVPTVATPATPTSVKATAIDSERIDITWGQVQGATAYEVYRNDAIQAIVESLIFSDTGLKPTTSYNYKIRAFNGTNYSAFSTVVSATTLEKVDTDKPEATISPEIPDETQPPVESNFSFVTIGETSYPYNEIPPFDPGESFTIYGRTVNFSDVEVAVSSRANSYAAKADDDGFWDISIDTSQFEAGNYSFVITITAEGFPESYTSESYNFEVNQVDKPEEEIEDENVFGSSLNRTITIAIIVLVLLMIILAFVAFKKGWFKKIMGKDDEKEPPKAPQDPTGDGNLENMINMDTVDSQAGQTEPTEPTEATEPSVQIESESSDSATPAENTLDSDDEIPPEMRIDVEDFNAFMEKSPGMVAATAAVGTGVASQDETTTEESADADEPVVPTETVSAPISADPENVVMVDDSVSSDSQMQPEADSSTVSELNEPNTLTSSEADASEMTTATENFPPEGASISEQLQAPEASGVASETPSAPVETKGPSL